jgi:hypothetical protein
MASEFVSEQQKMTWLWTRVYGTPGDDTHVGRQMNIPHSYEILINSVTTHTW